MPPTMIFNASPANPAAIDEARARARRERQSKTPGPGAYDAKKPVDGSGQVRASSAFKSRTERSGDQTMKDVGDPGLYNPTAGADLASKTSKTFNKSQQRGTGGFGTTSKRAELSQVVDNPGPGAYDSKEPVKPEAKHSSAFASQSKRGVARIETTPGVGEYAPENAMTQHVIGGEAAFKSKDSRFKADSTADLASGVGPGSYSQQQLTISASSSKISATRPGAAGFGTTTKKEFTQHISDAPGPGTYESKAQVTDVRPSSAFKSRTERTVDPTTKDVGDPGAYKPFDTTDLASKTSKTFNKSGQAGLGGFGTTSKRAALSAISDAPGPGSYDTKEAEKPEAKHSSAFASQTKRNVTKGVDTPGVGAYAPHVVDAGRVTGGESAFKSKDSRFKASKTDELAHVGPGTYTQEDATISRKASASVGKVSSAFASTTLRDGFLGV